MKTIFIEQIKKKTLFNRILKVRKRENKIIINNDIKFSKKIKIVKKIKQILENEKCRQVALEKDLKEDDDIIKLLYSNNINICNKKWLLKNIVDEVIEDVLNGNQRKQSEISICVNEIDTKVEEYILKFAREFKTINIITNHIGKFKYIEKELYNEGIIMNITNNKRKSLSKAKLILNVDYPKEILNQFTIFDKATIINLEGDIKINKKRFSGRIINDYKYNIDEQSDVKKYILNNALENYDERDICQVLEIVPKGILKL